MPKASSQKTAAPSAKICGKSANFHPQGGGFGKSRKRLRAHARAARPQEAGDVLSARLVRGLRIAHLLDDAVSKLLQRQDLLGDTGINNGLWHAVNHAGILILRPDNRALAL